MLESGELLDRVESKSGKAASNHLEIASFVECEQDRTSEQETGQSIGEDKKLGVFEAREFVRVEAFRIAVFYDALLHETPQNERDL